MLSQSEERFLKRCAHSLLKRTDTSKSNGKGLSSYDIDSVKGISSKKTLTHPQAKYLKDTLQKYDGQLDDMGHSVERLKNIDVKIYEKGDVKIWFEGDEIDKKMVIKTPYDNKFVERIKSLPYDAREWDGDRKVWTVKVDYTSRNINKTLDWIYEAYGKNINPEIPKVKFGIVKAKSDRIIFDVGYDQTFAKKIKNLTYCNKEDDEWVVKVKDMDDIALVHDLIDKYDLETEGVYGFLKNTERRLEDKKIRENEIQKLSQKDTLNEDEDLGVGTPDNDLNLYPFQKIAVRILNLREKGLVADEMGTGKTPEVLTHLYNKKSFRPVLVVCPSSVKINWKREILRWTDAIKDNIELLDGRNNIGLSRTNSWFITNYAIVNDRLDDLLKMNWGAIVIDESHYIKNHEAQRTEAVKKLAKKVEHTYCLSGTPMPNKPIELYSQLQVLNIEEVPEFNRLFGNNGYAKRYCGAHKKRTKTREWWDLSGKTNMKELNEKLRNNIMIRRKKKDVLEDLPEKRRMKVSVGLDNREEYGRALNNFREWANGEDYGSANLVVQMEQLKQLVWQGKFGTIVDWVDDAFEQNDEKTILWAHHKELQRKLYNHYSDRAIKITGGMSGDEKQEVIDEFGKNDSLNICVASIKSANVGLNLQMSSRAVFCELVWTPSSHKQAEDRQHREGQKADYVDVYYLIAENTIEDYIFNLMSKKQRASDEALDGTEEEDEKGMAMKVAEKIVGEKEVKI